MVRTTADELHAEAVAALDEALAGNGCSIRRSKNGLLLEVPESGERPLEVIALSYAQPDKVARIARDTRADGIIRVLVADVVPSAAQALLREAGWGWLDRRGSLHIRAPGLLIDSSIGSIHRINAFRAKQAVVGRAGISAAAFLLMHPGAPAGVREIARQVCMSPSSISAALGKMREAALLSDDGRPLVPELFWELADAWNHELVGLQSLPDARNAVAARMLSFGLQPGDQQGWALTGTVAAAELGAPVAASADYPLDFYVPSPRVLRSAVQRLGQVRWEARACSAASALTPLVTSRNSASGSSHGPWPIAHPLFVALDLARDSARGVEILNDWTPPDGFDRVW